MNIHLALITKDISTKNSNLLNAIRGLSSLIVLIAHAVQIFKPSANYWAAPLAGASVTVFFVLSGFFIHKSLSKAFQYEEGWKRFLISRFDRIAPPFIACIFLTVLLWTLSPYLFSTQSYKFITPTAREAYSIDGLWVTILFLNGFLAPTLSSNGPLWSLTYEIWYYLLFLLFFKFIDNTRLLATVSIVIFILTLLSPLFLIYGSMWLIGVIVSILHANNKLFEKRISLHWLLTLALYIFTIAVDSSYEKYISLIFSLMFGLSFSLQLISIINFNNVKAPKMLIFLGDFSYSLYVFHFPILLFVYGINERGVMLGLALSLLVSMLIGYPLEKYRPLKKYIDGMLINK